MFCERLRSVDARPNVQNNRDWRAIHPTEVNAVQNQENMSDVILNGQIFVPFVLVYRWPGTFNISHSASVSAYATE